MRTFPLHAYPKLPPHPYESTVPAGPPVFILREGDQITGFTPRTPVFQLWWILAISIATQMKCELRRSSQLDKTPSPPLPHTMGHVFRPKGFRGEVTKIGMMATATPPDLAAKVQKRNREDLPSLTQSCLMTSHLLTKNIWVGATAQIFTVYFIGAPSKRRTTTCSGNLGFLMGEVQHNKDLKELIRVVQSASILSNQTAQLESLQKMILGGLPGSGKYA